MPITIYNTLTRKKETFKPINAGKVGLYTCGPTVYNFAHIGNLRTYIFEDVLRRVFEYAGCKVNHVMNITDVEDKIIRDAKAAGKTIFEFTAPYEKAFFEDIKKLNIEKAGKYPKATKHIKEMAFIIQKLLDNGLAYKANGSVFFSVSKFKDYGKLARVNLKKLKAGARVLSDEYSKEEVEDFALWKEKKDGEPFWKTPFGEGRPGWHIECSAMSAKYLGQPFDIHAGAVDLMFPHHENEIAQSEGAFKKRFAKYFVHGEHLLVNGEKMSKSLGNVFTLRDIEKKGIDPLVFRYLVLTSHYRSKLNFTWDSLKAAENSLNRLYGIFRNLKSSLPKAGTGEIFIKKSKKDFKKAIFNDLDTPAALSLTWKIIKDQKISDPLKRRILLDFDSVFGFGLNKIKPLLIPEDIKNLAEKRRKTREKNKWEEADKIREEINKRGWIIEDAGKGYFLKKS